MGSGARRMKSGSFYGTGADKNIDSVGFKPSVVMLINRNSHDKMTFTADMPDDSGHKQVAAGTSTRVTSNGITPRDGGFALGADADLNVDGELVDYIAWE